MQYLHVCLPCLPYHTGVLRNCIFFLSRLCVLMLCQSSVVVVFSFFCPFTFAFGVVESPN